MATRKTRRSARRATTRRTASNRVTRTTRRSSKAKGGSQWSREEIAFMRKYYRNNETSWVARQLGRTVYSVRYKASDLNIKKARPSVWRGKTGVSKPTATRRTQSRRPKTSWKAASRRTRPNARRATSRRSKSRRARR